MRPYTHRHTLKRDLHLSGVGLHTGRHCAVRITPAPAGTGVVFQRTDMPLHKNTIAALWSNAVPAALCTRLINHYGASVSTIEHLMAALHASAITDAIIALDGDEVPILDGSARPWMRALRHAGTVALPAPAPVLRVTRPIFVHNGAAWARLRPNPGRGLVLTCTIDFATPAIGTQTYTHALTRAGFLRHIAPARTFCQAQDIRALHQQGLALGGNLERAVIFKDTGTINPTGLRFDNEPVRHKLLDAVGDLYLAGAQWEAVFESNRPGHALTGLLLQQAFSQPGALVTKTTFLARERAVLA